MIDLVEKFERLASDGSDAAAVAANRVGQGRALGDANPGAIRQMQEIESQLLAVAVELEILDPIERAARTAPRRAAPMCTSGPSPWRGLLSTPG